MEIFQKLKRNNKKEYNDNSNNKMYQVSKKQEIVQIWKHKHIFILFSHTYVFSGVLENVLVKQKSFTETVQH